MNLAGRMTKSGRWWEVEVPALRIFTQGKSRKDALFMAADAANLMAETYGLTLRYTATEAAGDHFVMVPDDADQSIAYVLKRQREAAGLTLAQVAAKLGYKSIDGYATYEQGRRSPGVEKLSEMLATISSRRMVVTVE